MDSFQKHAYQTVRTAPKKNQNTNTWTATPLVSRYFNMFELRLNRRMAPLTGLSLMVGLDTHR